MRKMNKIEFDKKMAVLKETRDKARKAGFEAYKAQIEAAQVLDKVYQAIDALEASCWPKLARQ